MKLDKFNTSYDDNESYYTPGWDSEVVWVATTDLNSNGSWGREFWPESVRFVAYERREFRRLRWFGSPHRF